MIEPVFTFDGGFEPIHEAPVTTSALVGYAAGCGRKWADDQAAAGHLAFAPTSAAALAMLEPVARALHRAMAEEMARAATARRDELVAEASARAAAETAASEAEARAAADARAAAAAAEWEKRQKAAAEEKRERAATPRDASDGTTEDKEIDRHG